MTIPFISCVAPHPQPVPTRGRGGTPDLCGANIDRTENLPPPSVGEGWGGGGQPETFDHHQTIGAAA